MKKNGIMNGPISSVIAHLAHTDMVTIADAGLPIPSTTKRIDLALKPGVPGLLETIEVILTEMHVEKAFVSEDLLIKNPQIYTEIQRLLIGIAVEPITHADFKQLSGRSMAIIRTGELTPYANVILVAGAWGFKL